MSYSIRHSVFVSSTFTDLVEERSEVIQALWEMDCIPTGMEAFVASNQSQWEVIQRVIDECDYYVLIIGGRYGSVTEEGISYTEKEYRYASELGVPVLAFVHSNPEAIPVGKSEKDREGRDRLEAFRKAIMDQYPVRAWSTAQELGALVSRSLIREIRINPRPGWLRNDGSSPIALLERIKDLTEENEVLRNANVETDFTFDETLEQGSDEIELSGGRTVRHDGTFDRQNENWNAMVSWDQVFKDMGPSMINEATENELKSILARFTGWDEPRARWSILSAEVSPEAWNEVLVQLRALGLIEQGEKKRGVNDKNRYWKLTRKGDRYLLTLLARRRSGLSTTVQQVDSSDKLPIGDCTD
ncbi:DUF4062 domain-containing protein [Aurantiacibacter gangjinensis]|uniref:DUF4062 domain-containing protein n=1 Tax=Aurantiacibacter gangjinensis TaxID=502682 RepID=UPI00069C5D72|nr:DUF4062 domain-containing protein [Aurantiacibacter gangjinensis]